MNARRGDDVRVLPVRASRVRLAATKAAWVVLGCLAPFLTQAAGATPPSLGDVLDRLRSLAEVEGGAVEPGLDDEREVAGAEGPRLTEVIDARAHDARPAFEAPEPVAREAGSQALRLFASGRLKRLSGDLDGAIGDLEAASEIDPSSHEVWAALGVAQRDRGLRASAFASFELAFERGSVRPDLVAALGLERWRTGRFEDAANVLSLAAVLDRGPAAQGGTNAIHIALGETLLELGFPRAGAEALELGLAFPRAFDPSTPYRAELSSIIRRRGDLWRLAGDAWSETGDSIAASRAYERASEYPMVDPGALLARRLETERAAGRSAMAAVVLLEQLAESDGVVDARQLELVEQLATLREVGPLVADGLAALRAAIGNEDPHASDRLWRAEAIARPADPSVLAGRLSQPGAVSPVVARAFLAGLARGGEGPDGWSPASVIEAVLEASPDVAVVLAEVLPEFLGTGNREIGDLEGNGWRSAALGAVVRASRGEPADVDRASAPAAGDRLALWARARVAASSGDWETYEAALNTWPERPGDALPVDMLRADTLYADALIAGGRLADARAVLDRVAEVPAPAMLEHLLARASLAVSTGDDAGTRAALIEAARLAPSDDRPVEALLSGSLRGPAVDDAANEGEFLRALRDASPSSRLIRRLSASELLRAGLLTEAERSLRTLAEPGPDSPTPAPETVALLVQVWSQNGSVDAGEQWLRARLAESPSSESLRVGLAQLLAVDERLDGAADALLEGWTESGSLVLLEASALLRAQAAADESVGAGVVIDELGGRARSLDASMLYATSLATAGRLGDAGDELAGWPSWVETTEEQRERLERLLRGAVLGSLDDLAAASEALLGLYDRVEGLGVGWGVELDQVRIQLLTERPADQIDLARLADAATRERDPAGQLHTVAAQRLSDIDQSLLVEYAQLVTRRSGPVEPRVVMVWVTHLLNSDEIDATAEMFTVIADRDDLAAIVNGLPGSSVEFVAMGRGPAAAELGYRIASTLVAQGRDDDGERLYLMSLERWPEHPWVCNDYGYMLLERGGQLQRADDLISIAAAQLPNNANVLDSLGWVRYLEGVFEDVVDENGEVLLEGARSLLERAAAAPGGSTNEIILDHLGDAAWRVGDREAALVAWRGARRQAQRELQGQLRAAARSEAVIARARAVVAAVDEKIAAAEAGREVPVAPTEAESEAVGAGAGE